MRHLALVFVAALLAGSTVAGQRQELWFPTGPPEMVEPSEPAAGAQQPLRTRAVYERIVNSMASESDSAPPVRIREVPEHLSPSARFGTDLAWGLNGNKFRHLVGYVVDGNPTRGYTLYVDRNANGTLRDDPPIPMERQKGYFTALIRMTVPATAEGVVASVPVVVRLVVVPSGGELKHKIYLLNLRRGIAQVGARKVAFALRGFYGSFDYPGAGVWIDRTGHARDVDDPTSLEFLRVRDKAVTIDGTGYRFRVDPFGRSLGLMPLDTAPPERPTLKPGTLAPDFSSADIDGHPQSLTQYRGKVVLLDFWAVWCGPCNREGPILRAIYDRYRDAGFVMLGIAPDAKDEIRNYIATERDTWSQIEEPMDGPVHTLFRVPGYPTHVLVGRDGRIVTTEVGGVADASAAFENEVKQAVNAGR